MKENPKIGVYLCECGEKIRPLVDLPHLEGLVRALPSVDLCRVLPYPCLAPGLSVIRKDIEESGINRLVVAGCESRLMQHRLETELSEYGIDAGRIKVVNIRGHVAPAKDLTPVEKAEKGARLVGALAENLMALIPGDCAPVSIEGPVLIMGDGIATYSTAQELSRKGVECVMALTLDDEEEIRLLHDKYPGERHNYGRVRSIMKEVEESPLVARVSVGDPLAKSGQTGNYTVSFERPGEGPPLAVKAGLIIACLDGEMVSPSDEFGYNGKDVICQTEADELLWTTGIPQGKVLLWINDGEEGTPEFVQLSMKSAWSLARSLREKSDNVTVDVLYPGSETLPLSAQERAMARKLGIRWIPYDERIRPTVQDGNLTYLTGQDDLEREIPWDLLVLSPKRAVGAQARKAAKLLQLDSRGGAFLRAYHAPVRPESVGRKEMVLAGSAAYPCDLHQALAAGRRSAVIASDVVDKARAGKLQAPPVVSVIDPNKCVGCGQCEELCECGAIETIEISSGGFARRVDPLVCTGGGTGAAACPYNAMVLQNATTLQREAAAGALARELRPLDVAGWGCAWGGFASADNAGKRGIHVDSRLNLLQVRCVGQLDASVMARALMEGANGVILFGCVPGECHHSYGVDHGWSRVSMIRKLLALCGFERQRIALAHADFNAPEKFAASANAYVKMIEELGPIERTPRNREKLFAIYETTKNDRVRLLLSAALRRPWEASYTGNQRHALEYDREFGAVLAEELMNTRIVNALKDAGNPIPASDLAKALGEKKATIENALWDMSTEGRVHISHQEGTPNYGL